MTRSNMVAGGAALVLLALGCSGGKSETKTEPGTPTATQAPAAPTATANIESKSGSSVIGNVTFTPRGKEVHVMVQVQNAPPGQHGVHVHEKGDCSDPEGKSAGGHFNPAGVAHGGPTAAVHHPGDFGNITVGDNGTGTLELDTGAISATAEGQTSVIGKAVIIHEKADDLTTQPTGNAGGRIGCGVITAAQSGSPGQAPSAAPTQAP